MPCILQERCVALINMDLRKIYYESFIYLSVSDKLRRPPSKQAIQEKIWKQ